MPIVTGHGDLLSQDVDALVNAVNCVGAMGAGLARQFRATWPAMYADYRQACQRGDLAVGSVHVWEADTIGRPRVIINVPTKEHWRSPSRVEFVQAGVVALVEAIREREIGSVAVPALGCGLGGLEWSEVEPVLVSGLGGLDGVEVRLFAPRG